MKQKILKWLAVLFGVITLSAFGVACKEDKDIGDLTFKTFSVYNTVASGTVSNDTEVFSFKDEIACQDGTSFLVSEDMFGKTLYMAKKVPLEVGYNFFYILETVNGDVTNTYDVTIYRKDVYTVKFNTQGGTEIASQQVEEYGFATPPTKTPTREGFTFEGWDFDFTKPIMQNTTIKAKWMGAPYTLTIVYGNGQKDEQKTVTCGEELELDAPTQGKDGYVFTGWDVSVMPAENTVVTAQWQALFTVEGNTITGLTSYGRGSAEVVIPAKIDGVTIKGIANGAFSYEAFTSIKLPNGITSIGEEAFRGCALTSIEIPDGVTSIESETFEFCDDLTSIVIGNHVTNIKSWAFYNCGELTTVYYKGTESEWTELTDNMENFNSSLTDATCYYYVEDESDVPENGNYWHYVNGNPTAW